MSYSFIIKRGSDDNLDAVIEPITKEEWLSAINNRNEFLFDVGLERSDYNYAELDDGEGSWVHFTGDGTLTAKYTTPLFIYHHVCMHSDCSTHPRVAWAIDQN